MWKYKFLSEKFIDFSIKRNLKIMEDLTSEQAVIISSIISAIIALAIVFINRFFENRKKTKEKHDAIKSYANPIIFASEQLAWRLKEILEFKGAYLLSNAPQNGFFKYKFDSTVYRLCSLLGWIQAAKKEQSYLEGMKIKHHSEIQRTINDFQKKLADGSHVEVSILDDLIKLFNLKSASLSENERVLIGVELEKIVFKYISDNIKRNVNLLSDEKQIELVKEVLDHICEKTSQSKVEKEVIKENISSAINEISREFCWIYRDWQSAIGDEMIKEIEGANRRFDVVGFPEFKLFHEKNEWIKKAHGLFASLDVSVDDRFDARVQQLKQVFDYLIQLIEVLKKLIKKQETIPDETLKIFKDFNNKINKKNETKKVKRLKL